MPGSRGGQKRALDYLELEIQILISCYVGAGIGPRSSARAIRAILIAKPSLQPQLVGLCSKCLQGNF